MAPSDTKSARECASSSRAEMNAKSGNGGHRASAMTAYLRAAMERASERFHLDSARSNQEEETARSDLNEADRDKKDINAEDNKDNQEAEARTETTLDGESVGVAHGEQLPVEKAVMESPAWPISETLRVHLAEGQEQSYDDYEGNREEEDGDDGDGTTRVHSEGGGSPRWQGFDVLLQPDAYGLGLRLRGTLHLGDNNDNGGDDDHTEGEEEEPPRVVVTGFRRRHHHDVGPAEASQRIRAGDLLLAVDGYAIHSLRELQRVTAKIGRPDPGAMPSSPSPFMLLRFARQHQEPHQSRYHTASDDNGYEPASQSLLNQDGEPPSLSSTTTKPSQATPAPTAMVTPSAVATAVLIRNLVQTNQRLQDQLIASRLQQDEQRIQLEQLHALYARTQLENGSHNSSFPFARSHRGPAFAFTRRTSSNHSSGSSMSASTRSHPTQSRADSMPTSSNNSSSATGGVLSSAAAKLRRVSLPENTRHLHEIKFAVAAERERVTRYFDGRLEAARRTLRDEYEQRLMGQKALAHKKQRMLEHGVAQLLAMLEARATRHGRSEKGVEDAGAIAVRHGHREWNPPSCSRLHLLRHRLLHTDNEKDKDKERRRDCVLCLLLPEVDQVVRQHDSSEKQSAGERLADSTLEKAPLHGVGVVKRAAQTERLVCIMNEYRTEKQKRETALLALDRGAFATKAMDMPPQNFHKGKITGNACRETRSKSLTLDSYPIDRQAVS